MSDVRPSGGPVSLAVENESLKLSTFLKRELQLSSTQIKRCLHRGWILVNQLVPRYSLVLQQGDIVSTTTTSFAISQLRYGTQLLRPLFSNSSLKIVWKPGGMPQCGDAAETVEKALPFFMENDNYQIIDCVNRIASGPVIVRQNCQALPPHTKLYSFTLLVQGVPPTTLDMKTFQSMEVLHSIPTTTGTLSVIRVRLSHSGDGIRGCLARHKCPILGTTRTKSTVNGIFMACTRLEIDWLGGDDPTIVDMEVPQKFQLALEREKKFYEAKQELNREKDHQSAMLREDCLKRTGDNNLSLPKGWSVTLFRSLPFYVTKDVMEPRSCSEVLVNAAQQRLTLNNSVVLDLGTGSGCLLISTLIGADPSTRGVGVDISKEALNVAQSNVQSHHLSSRVVLREGSFADLSFLNQQFDIIVCNPPYLTEGERTRDCVPGPEVALAAGNRGLACYEMIAKQVGSIMKPSSFLVLEIGGKRKEDEILAIFSDLDHEETLLCSQGRKRCIVFRARDHQAIGV